MVGDIRLTQISAIFPPAFTGSPLPLRSPFIRGPQISTTPRLTRVLVRGPQARSIESYREGSRFGGEGRFRRAHNKEEQRRRNIDLKNEQNSEQSRRKLRVLLPLALSQMNVASFETCGFLVRSGRVQVNGTVVKDGKVKINRFDDIITVNGTEYGSMESILKEEAEEEDKEDELDDLNILPRAQKDFYYPGSTRNEDNIKKYNRRVDGGFYASRRYRAGK